MRRGLRGRADYGEMTTAVDRVCLLETVLENVSDAVVIEEAGTAHIEPHTVYVNAAFTRMTGYGAQEVIDGTPWMLEGPDTCPLSRAKLRDAIAHHQSVTVDLLHYRKDGGAYLVEISRTPVIDETGTCTHWITIQRNITQRRQSEEVEARARTSDEQHALLAAETKERQRAPAQVADTSERDDLTGLHNRAHFMRCLESAIARAQIDLTYTFSIVCVDLDRFKLVNDHLGHRTGDRILRDLAQRFEPLTGPRDTLARIGENEFGLLIDAPDDPADVANIAGRLLVEVSNRPSRRVDDVVVGASIGIVDFASGTTDAEMLMHDAGIALAHGRRTTGGGSYALFSPELRAKAALAAQTRVDLCGAVERGELRLYYQPLADIAIGGIYGFSRALAAPGARFGHARRIHLGRRGNGSHP
jgi:diguanylate cyclase (GGDEF)-like protein/PAS domain S-box-containing protein